MVKKMNATSKLFLTLGYILNASINCFGKRDRCKLLGVLPSDILFDFSVAVSQVH